MTVVLLLLLFLTFAVIDFFLTRRRLPVAKTEAAPVVPPFLQASVVEGFTVPEDLRYHHGHGWVYRERKNLARVGADEFAAVLAGKIDRIELPKPGQWLRQGQKAWSFRRNGEVTEMVSPIEGEVVAVNEELQNNPELLRKDPYGKGWMMTLFVPDEESTGRNLLPSKLVRAWMRDSVQRLYAMQSPLAGAVAADGGRPVDDVTEHLDAAGWKDITSEFFLTR